MPTIHVSTYPLASSSHVTLSPFVDAVNSATMAVTSSIFVGDSLDNGEDNQAPSNMPASFVVGRTSEVVLNILDEGFQRLHDEISEISIQSDLPPQQVVDRFIKNYSGSNNCPNVCMFFTKVDNP